MKDLIERSYQSIRKRGLINEDTTNSNFVEKMFDKCSEIEDELYKHNPESKYIEEVTELANVCILQIRHLGYDFESEFEKVIIKNENRSKVLK